MLRHRSNESQHRSPVHNLAVNQHLVTSAESEAQLVTLATWVANIGGQVELEPEL
jgi:hypothetical protein